MEHGKLREYERITQEMRGNLIKSDNWNNNFNRVSEVIKSNNEIIESNFENIKAETVPSPIIEDLNSPDSNTIYLQLIAIAAALVGKANKTDVESSNLINFSDVDFNSDTGVFTFTRNSGEVKTIDTALEKIPATLSLVDEDDKTYLVITNLDGSKTRTDVTKLFNIYNFADSSAIKANVDGYNVNFTIKANSITAEMLSPEILPDLQSLFDKTKQYMQAAEVSANTAKQNAETSTAAKNSAETAANSAQETLSAIQNISQEVSDDAKLAKSYAVGGTGTREGENTDNAKYYYEQAKAVASAGTLTVFIQSTEPDVNNCLWFKTTNTNT